MRLNGLIAAPFTPMKEDGSISLDVISHYANWLMESGVNGVFVCGTTGEGMSLTDEERMEVAEEWIKYCTSDFKVIVHVGSTSLESSRKLMVHADKLGASAVGMMGPAYLKPANVQVLVDYCQTVAKSAPDLPFYYYHMPSINGINFSMRSFLEHASGRIPNLAGIKYTYEDLMDFHLCQVFEDGRYDMLFGRDEILLCGLALGTKGAVGSTYNFAAPLYNQLMKAYNAGDLEEAKSLQLRSMEMIRTIVSIDSAFLPAAKSLMKLQGIDCGPVRLPMTNINERQYELLIQKFDQQNFLEK